MSSHQEIYGLIVCFFNHLICPQVVFFDLCPFYYQEGFLHMLGRKFLEKIDKNCNRLCVTEKKKKQTMHVHYCTITKSKSNHGSSKPQISGIHVCIIIWKHIHKKKTQWPCCARYTQRSIIYL